VRVGGGLGFGVLAAAACAALSLPPIASDAIAQQQAAPAQRPQPPADLPAAVPAQPPAQSLLITASNASTWSAGSANVVQLDGPVTIAIDKMTLSARGAVVWLEWAPDGQPGEELVTVALIGDARVQQPQAVRTAPEMIVSARVNGPIRITAENRVARDLSATPTFRAARVLRDRHEAQQPSPAPAPAPAVRPARPLARPTTRPGSAAAGAPSTPPPAPPPTR
jgi:hypothetical protein